MELNVALEMLAISPGSGVKDLPGLCQPRHARAGPDQSHIVQTIIDPRLEKSYGRINSQNKG